MTAPDRPDWLTYTYRPKAYDSTKRSESAKKRLKKRREKNGRKRETIVVV